MNLKPANLRGQVRWNNHKITHRKRIDFVDIIFGGSATALPPLKFQLKWLIFGVNDSGRRAGNSFEWSVKGYILNDNEVGAHRPSHFLRLKTLVASGILQSTSLYFALWAILQMFKMVLSILSRYSFLLLKKSIWFEGIRDKTITRTPRRTMARSVLLFL
jgi:hypothetical protein